jgi:hypothetical protein
MFVTLCTCRAPFRMVMSHDPMARLGRHDSMRITYVQVVISVYGCGIGTHMVGAK